MLSHLCRYTKPKGQLPDYSAPIVLPHDQTSVEYLCAKIHKSLLKEFKWYVYLFIVCVCDIYNLFAVHSFGAVQ
jgi:ribosome-interacting GTPase 1